MPLRIQGRCGMGSPAHAGIDLLGVYRMEGGARFPRTRGDRPVRVFTNQTAVEVPPHTRG